MDKAAFRNHKQYTAPEFPEYHLLLILTPGVVRLITGWDIPGCSFPKARASSVEMCRHQTRLSPDADQAPRRHRAPGPSDGHTAGPAVVGDMTTLAVNEYIVSRRTADPPPPPPTNTTTTTRRGSAAATTLEVIPGRTPALTERYL